MKKIVLFLFLAIPFVSGRDFNKSELVSIVIIFRHGARTILKPYRNDPYKNESLWPVGFGQLTNEGKIQLYELGQYFREFYNGFIPKKYSEKEIYVRSTDVDRTLMSAESYLAGLFPPEGDQIWDKNILWQPIPVHTQPQIEDAVLAAKKPCLKYNLLFDDLKNSEEMKKINRDNQELYEYLTKHSGDEIKDFHQMHSLYTNLFIEELMNFTLPNWTKKVFPHKMKGLYDFTFSLPCYTKELARLKVGPFFDELLRHFNEVINNDFMKLKIFSAHDTTLANLLKSLDIFEYHSPPFGSTLIFEMHQNKSSLNHFIKIYYKNGTNPNKMILKGCDFECDLEIFKEILESLSVSLNEWERECDLFKIGGGEKFFVVIIGLLILSKLIYYLYKKSYLIKNN